MNPHLTSHRPRSALENLLLAVGEAVTQIPPEEREEIFARHADDLSRQGLLMRTLMAWASAGADIRHPDLCIVEFPRQKKI